MLSDGRKACGCGCGRPRDREGQSYRRDCHAAYMRAWRQGKLAVLLLPEEWAGLQAARAAAAAGKNAAAAELGRLRAERLTAERRSEIARAAARARWSRDG